MPSIDDIMNQDDSVDALSDIGVMDCYNRMRIMRMVMDMDARIMQDPLFQEGEDRLESQTHEGVRMFTIKAADRGWLSRDASKLAHQYEGEAFTKALFGKLTTDDMSNDKLIRVARAKLKQKLRGSMGMPDSNVVRATMRNVYEI